MGDSDSKKEEKIIVKVKNATDLQRLKLEKLMKNPDKPIVIPDRPRDKALSAAPDFVRNVMGSSAGAGSGEFHVYRHLRRKEYARQKFIVEKSEKEKLDDEYHSKIEQNKRLAEEKTAKKRAKRLKKKKLAKIKGKKPKTENKSNNSSQSESSEGEEDNDDEKFKHSSEDVRCKEDIDEEKVKYSSEDVICKEDIDEEKVKHSSEDVTQSICSEDKNKQKSEDSCQNDRLSRTDNKNEQKSQESSHENT